jgi:hypothetical protein
MKFIMETPTINLVSAIEPINIDDSDEEDQKNVSRGSSSSSDYESSAVLNKGNTSFNIPSELDKKRCGKNALSPKSKTQLQSPSNENEKLLSLAKFPRSTRDALKTLVAKNEMTADELRRQMTKNLIRRLSMVTQDSMLSNIAHIDGPSSRNPFFVYYEIYGELVSKDALVEVRKCRNKKSQQKRLVKIIRNDTGFTSSSGK